MSLPHQPPLCGVSSGWPVRSVISGPTIVPWRVSTASTAAARLLIRFITLSSCDAMSSAFLSQSRCPRMKNVVLPESP